MESHGRATPGWIGFAEMPVEPEMYQYRVIESWVDVNRYVFRCSSGRFHLARALNGVPPADVPLRGDKPHLGFAILVCARTGSIHRMIFESINEAQVASVPGRAQNMPSASARASDNAFGNAG